MPNGRKIRGEGRQKRRRGKKSLFNPTGDKAIYLSALGTQKVKKKKKEKDKPIKTRSTRRHDRIMAKIRAEEAGYGTPPPPTKKQYTLAEKGSMKIGAKEIDAQWEAMDSAFKNIAYGKLTNKFKNNND